MVCAAEIAPRLPASAGRSRAWAQPRRALRGSRLLRPDTLRKQLEQRARALGFDSFGVCSADAVPHAGARLRQWLDEGRHGDMLWMAETVERRAAPKALWSNVRSVIMLGMNYGEPGYTLEHMPPPSDGLIALYAQRRDYHEIVKGKLKELAGLVASAGADVKVFVDTAPVLEKPLAEAAGLGWLGKNTMLVSREYGNWLLLGAIYTTLDLSPSAPGTDACGSCTRCLTACPTQAFPAPYTLDARRCISYLTIEHKGLIPKEFRQAIGNRIFGCDDCLAVCPWNKFAQESREQKLARRDMDTQLTLRDLLKLDDGAFRTLFAGTPVKRSGRDSFLRNVLIACGNSGDTRLIGGIRRLLEDLAPEVRGTAIWALARLDADDAKRAASSHLPREENENVRAEWLAALEDQAE